MTIQEVKDQLGYAQLPLTPALLEDDTDTGWLRFWDNDNRVSVSMHRDTATRLSKEGDKLNLGIQEGEREGKKGKYKTMRIVAYQAAEFTF